jgi:hypothetical protein
MQRGIMLSPSVFPALDKLVIRELFVLIKVGVELIPPQILFIIQVEIVHDVLVAVIWSSVFINRLLGVAWQSCRSPALSLLNATLGALLGGQCQEGIVIAAHNLNSNSKVTTK